MAVSGSAADEIASGTEKAGSEEAMCCSSSDICGGRWPRLESAVRSIASKRSGKEDVSTLLFYRRHTAKVNLFKRKGSTSSERVRRGRCK